MPALNFEVTWPDGEEYVYYSPSTVLTQHLQAQTDYSLDDFSVKIQQALSQASERVEAKFGFRCSAAEAELKKIQQKISDLKNSQVSRSVFINKIYPQEG